MLIGLTGTKASGKGEVVEILKEKSFLYLSLSNLVREESVKRGIENYTIKDLQNIGDDLRMKFGNSILAKRALQKLNQREEKKNCIIDGIRNVGEIEELKKAENFILISVDAPQKERFNRLINRGRDSDPKTWEEFLKMDERDRFSEKEAGQQVSKCMERADIKIFNDSSIEKLREEVEKICKKLKC